MDDEERTKLDFEDLMALIAADKAGVRDAILLLQDHEFAEKLESNVEPQSDEKVREAVSEICSHLVSGDRDDLKSALERLKRWAKDGNQAAVSTYEQLMDLFDEQVRKQGFIPRRQGPMKGFLREWWAWLEDRNNRGRVAVIAAVAVPIIALLGLIIDINPPDPSNPPNLSNPSPNGEVHLSIKGALDIRDPTVDESEVSIGLLWGIEDDQHYYWTDGALSGTEFSVTITMAAPPEDALMFISPGESSTPGRQALLKLGVAFLIAYRDQNATGLYDRGDELLGGCPTHVVAFRNGPLPGNIEWSLSEGFSIAEAISPEEHGLETRFDILRSVQSSTQLSVVVPQSRDEIRFPNWDVGNHTERSLPLTPVSHRRAPASSGSSSPPSPGRCRVSFFWRGIEYPRHRFPRRVNRTPLPGSAPLPGPSCRCVGKRPFTGDGGKGLGLGTRRARGGRRAP